MSNIPKELQEMFDLSQSVNMNDLSKLISAAKEFHEFREIQISDETFHDLKRRIEKLEIAMHEVINAFSPRQSIATE